MRILPPLIRTVFVPVCLLLGCPRTVAYPALMHKRLGLAFSRSDRGRSGFAARRPYGRGTLSLRPAAELGWLWPGLLGGLLLGREGQPAIF